MDGVQQDMAKMHDLRAPAALTACVCALRFFTCEVAFLQPAAPVPQIMEVLNSRILLTKAGRRRFPGGSATAEGIISTCRYIGILGGRMTYKIEGVSRTYSAGALLLVPAWIRRRWRVPKGAACELVWCEFSIPSCRNSAAFVSGKEDNSALEFSTLKRILALWEKAGGTRRDGGGPSTIEGWKDLDALSLLMAEGELKASLARFLPDATTVDPAKGANTDLHPEIRRLLAWIERHYGEVDALDRAFKESHLSPNHLRLLFRQQVGMAPTLFLKSVRLRHARDLLATTVLSVKEVAAAVGIEDNLYFSKAYRAFWGKSPRDDRR